MRFRVGAIGAVVLMTVAVASSGRATQGPAQGAAVRGLLLADDAYSYPGHTVRIASLAGKRLSVPPRVRYYPSGLSPDGRLIAGSPSGLEGGSDSVKVVLGHVRNGPMKTILRAECGMKTSGDEPVCGSGADPSLAWSPNGQRLAVAANVQRPPTLLKLFDRSGRIVRSFALPRFDEEQGGRAYYEVRSWSPDGSRLLLLRSNPYVPTAYQALEIKTGKLRTLVDGFNAHNGGAPELQWSPDGVLLAAISDDPYEGPEIEVVDVASRKAVVRCQSENSCKKWQPLIAGLYAIWTPDSRGFLARSGNAIVRIGLNGHRATVVPRVPTSAQPLIAFGSKLVYVTWPHEHSTLFLFDRSSRHQIKLGRWPSRFVRPLARIP